MARAHQAEQTAATCAKAIPVADVAVAELSISGEQNESRTEEAEEYAGTKPWETFFP